jgi:hypothetical protein
MLDDPDERLRLCSQAQSAFLQGRRHQRLGRCNGPTSRQDLPPNREVSALTVSSVVAAFENRGAVCDWHSHQRRIGVRLRRTMVGVEVVSRRIRAFGVVGQSEKAPAALSI